MLLSAIGKTSADEKGNFIERNLAEIELHKDDEDSCFHDKTGFMHMKGMLMDLFVAGTLREILTVLKHTICMLNKFLFLKSEIIHTV